MEGSWKDQPSPTCNALVHAVHSGQRGASEALRLEAVYAPARQRQVVPAVGHAAAGMEGCGVGVGGGCSMRRREQPKLLMGAVSARDGGRHCTQTLLDSNVAPKPPLPEHVGRHHQPLLRPQRLQNGLLDQAPLRAAGRRHGGRAQRLHKVWERGAGRRGKRWAESQVGTAAGKRTARKKATRGTWFLPITARRFCTLDTRTATCTSHRDNQTKVPVGPASPEPTWGSSMADC